MEIWWDPSDIADTVMDFGVTLEGAPVTLTFKVVNRSSADVGILQTNQFAEPYFLILNTPDLPAEHPRKEEFQAAAPQPYIVAAGDTGAFGVTFRALKDNPLYPPDVATQALLVLRVVPLTDSLGPSTDHTFLLRAIKTTNVLASSVQRIIYDSVYVGPRPVPPQTPYRVQNVLTVPVRVERQLLEMKTSVVGSPEIEVDTFQSAEFGPQATLTWTTRYAPRDMGRDSAHFLVVYKLNENAVSDTVEVVIDGTGVEQRLNIIDATGTPQSVRVSGDTVHFGDVNADGKGGVTATIIVRNEGNVNIRMTNETEFGIARDTLAYKIERPLRAGNSDIRTNRLDTLIVRLDPVEGGDHRIRYDIHTDLRERNITGVPDGAQVRSIFFEAFARKPQIQVLTPTIDFGQVVVLDECQSASERQLLIRNVGNVELIVDSIIVMPKGAPIQVTPTNARVGVARTETFTVRYEPTDLGLLEAQLVLYTNAFGEAINVPCFGSSIGPDTITVSIDSTLRSRPGRQLVVAIRADGDRARLTERARVTLAFDPRLMLYRSLLQTGTATEGALANGFESPRGILTINLVANGTFVDRDTLIFVTFDTFLGTLPKTAIAMSPQTTQFGNAGCASVLDVTVRNGAFAIDSICGLDIKTATVQGFLVQAAIFPNPASDDIRLTVSSGKEQRVTTRLIDMFGREHLPLQQHDIHAGLSVLSLPVPSGSSGTYYVEVATELQRLLVPVVVER